MMDGLKMPDALSGFGFDANDAVAEKIVAEAVPAIHIACRRSERQIDVAQLFVSAEIGPGIDGARVFPGAVFPRLDAKLAFPWNDSKFPAKLARPNIVPANVAWRAFLKVRVIRNRGADDNNVFDDKRRRRPIEWGGLCAKI